MPYSITTKDGITINNIPDDVAPDSPELKERVAQIRLTGGQAQPAAPAMPPDTLGRQVGLATRPMAQSVLTAGGLLPMVVDPMVNLFNLAAGTSIPTQTQDSSWEDVNYERRWNHGYKENEHGRIRRRRHAYGYERW